MNSSRFIFFIGIFSTLLVVLLSACATIAAPPAKTVVVVANTPDMSAPTTPVPAFVIEPPKPAIIEPEALPARGSVASVVKKMETSPYTLYWKDSNSYSYYVGGLLDAEFKPGSGLIVQEAFEDDTGITCQFSEAGVLSQTKGAVDVKTEAVCSELMFTLDDELSD